MQLTDYELKAIDKYISAFRANREPSDVLTDCRTCVVALLQNISLTAYDITDQSPEFEKSIKGYLIRKGFFSKKDFTTGHISYHSQWLNKVLDNINIIMSTRNFDEYKLLSPTEDEALKSKSALNIVFDWYINKYRKIPIDNIRNISDFQKENIVHIFKTQINRKERIIERENYYVILLIDSSQSMVWPYLDDPANSNKESTKDYQNAVLKVQTAMAHAQKKALDALRGSAICTHRYMFVYQYYV